MGKKNALIFRTRQRVISFQWQTQWGNLQTPTQTYQIHQLLKKYLETQGLFVNTFFLRQTHQGLRVQVQAFGPHRRTKKFFSLGKQRLKQPFYLRRLIQAMKSYGEFPRLGFNLQSSHQGWKGLGDLGWGKRKFLPLPFRRYKDKPYFLESFHILSLLRFEQLTASYLAHFVYAQVRRNPERFAFTVYLGRFFQWFFNTRPGKLRLRGLRIEVKGRFKPGERTKKTVLSLGQISYQEFGESPTNQMDYSSRTAITKFGSLNVQVWLVLYQQKKQQESKRTWKSLSSSSFPKSLILLSNLSKAGSLPIQS